jgi:hypothetical protein
MPKDPVAPVSDNNEITGILSTCVIRSKVEAKGNKVYIVDLKIISHEASDTMFKLEGYLKKFVGLSINVKQLKLGDKI